MLMCLILTVCGLQSCVNASNAKQLEAQVGKQVLTTIQNAETVTQFYVTFDRTAPNFKATSEEVVLSDEAKGKLHQLLLDDEHFVHGLYKSAVFLPETAFKFHRTGEADIVILFAPQSNQLAVIGENERFVLNYDPAKGEFDQFLANFAQK